MSEDDAGVAKHTRAKTTAIKVTPFENMANINNPPSFF
jgi:hypothetical protein